MNDALLVAAFARKKALEKQIDLRSGSCSDWAKKVLGITPWSYQEELSSAIKLYDNISIVSCHSIGKTFWLAVLSAWFPNTRDKAVVAITAPGFRQVEKGIFRELHKLKELATRNGYTLPGRMTSVQYEIDKGRMAYGFATDNNSEVAAQGVHEGEMLIIGDEASGISESVHRGLRSMISGGKGKMIYCANPLDVTGPFARTFESDNWYNIQIGAYDSPNFANQGITEQHIIDGTWREIDNPETHFPGLIKPEYASSVLHDDCYGDIDNPIYVSRVRGEFPKKSPNDLFGLSDIDACIKKEPDFDGPIEIIVDVAWQGGDASVIGLRKGMSVSTLEKVYGDDPTVISNKVCYYIKQYGAKRAKVDIVGIGAGVVSNVRHAGYECIGINGAAKAKTMNDDGTKKYINARHEMYFELSGLIRNRTVTIPNDRNLKRQLLVMKFFAKNDMLQIDPKEKIKKELNGQSPDEADMVAMAFYEPAQKQEPVFYVSAI